MSAVDKLLEDMTGKPAELYFAAIQDFFVALVTNNRPAAKDALRALAVIVTETLGMAEILGAVGTLRQAATILQSTGVALQADREHLLAFAGAPSQTILPRVTLDEAVQDMVDRTPVTIRRAAERTAQRIAQLYGEGPNVAFVRSAEAAVTQKAQDFIAQALREGIPEGQAGERLAMSVNEIRKRSRAWSESYARMVFRTNVNTAVTAGRFRQAQDPDIKEVIPAFRFDAVGDADTRDNHMAADGIILSVDSAAWRRIAPPLGYNCRCQVSLVSSVELKAMGRIDSSGKVRDSKIPSRAKPDPKFRHSGRPDLFMVSEARQ